MCCSENTINPLQILGVVLSPERLEFCGWTELICTKQSYEIYINVYIIFTVEYHINSKL